MTLILWVLAHAVFADEAGNNATVIIPTAPPMDPLATCGEVVEEFTEKLRTKFETACTSPPKSREELIQNLVLLIETIEEYPGKTVPWIYVGCDNNDFTGIIDCWDPSIGPVECAHAEYSDEYKAALMKYRWKVNSRNDENLPSAGGRWEGALAQVEGKWEILHMRYMGDYMTVERPWYTQEDGWGEAYVFASQAGSCRVVYGTTFVGKVANGTVGVDKIGVCAQGGEGMTIFDWRGWNGCTVEDPCTDGFGDCGSDDECLGDLVCWNRQQGTTKIPWNTGGAYDMTSFSAIQLNYEVLNLGNADFCVRLIVDEVDELDVTEMILAIFGAIVGIAIIVYLLSKFGILTWLRHAFLGDLMLSSLVLLWKIIDLSSTYYAFFVEINPLQEVTHVYRILFVTFMVFNTICYVAVSYYVLIQIRYLLGLQEGINEEIKMREKFENDINICQVSMISFVFEDLYGAFLQLMAIKWYSNVVTVPFLLCVFFQCFECGIGATAFSTYAASLDALEMATFARSEEKKSQTLLSQEGK